MSDLQETLKMLGDTVPKITDEMNQLVHQGEEAQKEADELLKLFESTEAEANEVFKQIEQALAALKDDAAQHLAELNGELAAIEKDMEDVKHLEQARDEVKNGAEAAGHAMESFRSKLQEGSEDLKHAHEEFKTALDHVKQGVEEGHDQLEAAQNALHDAGESLQHKITDSQNTITDLVQNVFHNAMNQHLQETEQKVGDFLSQAQTLGEQFQHGAEDILNNVVKAKSNEIMEMAKDKIEQELKSLMDKATDEICNAIQEMADKVTGAKDSSSSHRSVLKPIFDQIDNFRKPIESAIDSIKDACEMVGIDFA